MEEDGLTKVQVTIDLKKILDIDEVKNEITFKFTAKLAWRDSRLEFHFLKDNEDRNIIQNDIWVCHVSSSIEHWLSILAYPIYNF